MKTQMLRIMLTGLMVLSGQMARSQTAHETCEPIYRNAPAAECGIEQYRLGRGAECGVELYKRCRVGGCFGPVRIKRDRRCGVEAYRECRHPNFGIESFLSCRVPANGIERTECDSDAIHGESPEENLVSL